MVQGREINFSMGCSVEPVRIAGRVATVRSLGDIPAIIKQEDVWWLSEHGHERVLVRHPSSSVFPPAM